MRRFLEGVDEEGFPVLLDDSTAVLDPPKETEDDAPAPEPTNDPPAPAPTRLRPADIETEEWEHRIDAVRDAARENDVLSEGDVKDFIGSRLRDPEKFDSKQFVADVRAHRLDDLADIIDHKMRGDVEGMLRSRRYVRLVAPRGWVKRVFNGLDDDEMHSLVRRLEKRGWERRQIVTHVISKLGSEERRAQFIEHYQEEK